MKFFLLSVTLIAVVTGYPSAASAEGITCNFQGKAANGRSFQFSATLENTAEISVMPNGAIIFTDEQRSEWLEQNQEPGISYDDSSEGQKNLMALMHDTILFAVESDWESTKNKIQFVAIYRIDQKLSLEQGPVVLGMRDSTGSRRLALSVQAKLRSRIVPISIVCHE